MATTTVISPVQSCKVAQAYLATVNQPGAGALELGFLESLMSAQNMAGYPTITINGDGKPISGSSCRMILKYTKPFCGDLGTDTTLCNTDPDSATNPFGNAEFQFQSTDIKSSLYQLEETQFDCSCDPQDRQIAEILNQRLRAIMRGTERNLIASGIACAGDYCNGEPSNELATVQTINIFNADGNAAQPAGWWFVKEQMNTMGMTGRPTIVGGNAVAKYLWMQSRAGLGANAIGANTSVSADFDFYYSSEFDTVAHDEIGAGDYALVYAPGVFHKIDYNENVGPRKTRNSDTNLRGTIEFSNNGRSYLVDYETLYKEDCRKWSVLPVKTTGLFCLPDDDLCPDIVGNGRFVVKLGCGDVDCGPLCDGASS